MASILVVDDDDAIRSALRRALRYEGYEVHEASDGRAALDLAGSVRPDLVILDWTMPTMSGIDVCRELRTTGAIAILMLTARDASRDRVTGLDSGADDYLVKPFDLDELLARVRALIRRHGRTPVTAHAVGDLRLDEASRAVTRSDRAIALTPREYELLVLLARHAGEVVTRQQILSAIWKERADANVVDVYLGSLRSKLGQPPLIHNLRGHGFILRADGG